MNKFPWNCGECPLLVTYDLSIDDLTHVCLWSKAQIDDCDRYKSAQCPLDEHDAKVRDDERAKVIDEILFRISKITTYYAGGKDGKAITPVMFIRDEVVKTIEQMEEKGDKA